MEFDKRTLNEDRMQLNRFTVIRTIVMMLVIALVVLNNYTGLILPNTQVECLLDKAFVVTADINNYLKDNQTALHVILALSSLCVDFCVLYFCFYWACWGKTWRPIVTFAVFYTVRGLTQYIFQMKYPEGYLWESPGFPSIMVSYLKTNDFFFSGHVGFPIILACEAHNLKMKKMTFFCIFTFAFEAFTMIVTRGHYSIDLFAGAIIAHYTYIHVENYIHLLDNSCFSIYRQSDPLFRFNPIDEETRLKHIENTINIDEAKIGNSLNFNIELETTKNFQTTILTQSMPLSN